MKEKHEFDLEIKKSLNNIVELLKTERQKASMSQLDLSLTAGLAQNHVYAIEAGQRYPSMSTLLKICKALNLNPATLFDPPPTKERLQDRKAVLKIINKYI